MNKQTFQIPDGCKAVTMEQVGNQLIATFEPEFKKGDVIYCEDDEGFNWVFILDKITNTELNPYNYFCSYAPTERLEINNCCRAPDKIMRHATPEEAQILWDALAKIGKRWNPEKMKIEDSEKKRWRANHYKEYYYINPHFEISCEKVDAYDFIDNERYSIGNYFQTKEQAEKALQKLKKMLLIFWKEELNKS